MEGIGRPPRVVTGEIVRSLTAEDLVRLEQVRGVKAPSVRKLTDMHHSIARLVAQGEAGYAIALATGYSESRISILKADPAFQELVEAKRAEVEDIRHEAHARIQTKLTAMSIDGLDILHEKMLEREMNVRELQDNAKMTLDRAGFGPASTSQSLNVNLDYAGQIAEGRQRADQLTLAIPAAKAGRPLAGPAGPVDAPKVIEQVDFTRGRAKATTDLASAEEGHQEDDRG
jgi:hypothetical protein